MSAFSLEENPYYFLCKALDLPPEQFAELVGDDLCPFVGSEKSCSAATGRIRNEYEYKRECDRRHYLEYQKIDSFKKGEQKEERKVS